MIRPVLAVMTVCFSLSLMANEEYGSDYTTVNGWENQSTENDSEGSFDPSMMFNNEEDEIGDDAEYNQFESAYDDDDYYDSDMDEDDSEMYDGFDESDEQSESDYYEEE
ncbi:hypothetical protein NX722_01295 [Endozoicomonas gorgoniicola]|uniref:Uncharacterized protein n=1 Tax=Endozoicomonas gorgoniicola TaxID=1234144 RepID=A0ABT3MPL9_9GAMM|nr:hypothetical protein [Endozoicomonas gorgoniicola]MCW7551296.1 hypothetical protein [Endozoicomonas gorgoniicola]